MGTTENKIFNSLYKLIVYCRYIDDIFVIMKFERDITQLNKLLHVNSKLKFTVEISNDNKLPY